MLNLCAFRCDYPRPKRARIFGRINLPPKTSRTRGVTYLIHAVRQRTNTAADYGLVKQSPDPTFLLSNSELDEVCQEESLLRIDPTTKLTSLDDVIESNVDGFSQKQEIMFFIPIAVEPTLSTTLAMSVLVRDEVFSVSTVFNINWGSFSDECKFEEQSRSSSTSTFAERDDNGLLEKESIERTWAELQVFSTQPVIYDDDIGVKLSWTTFRPVRANRPMLELLNRHSTAEQCMTLDVAHIAFAELKQYEEDGENEQEIHMIIVTDFNELLDMTDQQVHMLSNEGHKSIFFHSIHAEMEDNLSEFRTSSFNKAASMLSKLWLTYVHDLPDKFAGTAQTIFKLASFVDESYGSLNSVFTESTLSNHIPIKAFTADCPSTLATTSSHLALLTELLGANDSSNLQIFTDYNDSLHLLIDANEWEAMLFTTSSLTESAWEKPFFELVEDAFCPGILVIASLLSSPVAKEKNEQVVEHSVVPSPTSHQAAVETVPSAAASPAKEANLLKEVSVSQTESQLQVQASLPTATSVATSVAVKRTHDTTCTGSHETNKRIKLDSLLLGVDSVDAYLILRENQQQQPASATPHTTAAIGVKTSAFLVTQPRPVPSLPVASLASMMDTSKASSTLPSPPPVTSRANFAATRMGGLQILVADDFYEAKTDLISSLYSQYEIICKDFALCDEIVMFVISECTAIVYLDVNTWLKPELRRNWLLNMSQIALRYSTIWVLLQISETNINEANCASLLAQVDISMFKFPCRVVVRECLVNDIHMQAELIAMTCQVDVKASQGRDDRSLTTYKRRTFFNLLDREYIAATCDFLQQFPTINLFTALLLVLTHENMSEIASSTTEQVQDRLHKVSPNGNLLAEKIYRFMQALRVQLN